MAFGAGTISSIGGAVQDIFGADAHGLKADGLRLKAKGLELESQNYRDAAGFATQNAEFTRISTGIKMAQLDRENYKALGGITADVAGAGFAASGSALDVLRDSASQGALMKQVAGTQGLIQEEGYQVQSRNYLNMSKAADFAAQAEEKAAQAEDSAADASKWSAAFKGLSAVTSIFF